jgi:hypothetical protein
MLWSGKLFWPHLGFCWPPLTRNPGYASVYAWLREEKCYTAFLLPQRSGRYIYIYIYVYVELGFVVYKNIWQSAQWISRA